MSHGEYPKLIKEVIQKFIIRGLTDPSCFDPETYESTDEFLMELAGNLTAYAQEDTRGDGKFLALILEVVENIQSLRKKLHELNITDVDETLLSCDQLEQTGDNLIDAIRNL